MVTLMDPNDPQEERVFLALRRLQLPHLRDTLAAVLSEAAKEQWTYLEFLDQILRREVDAKQGKRIRMGLQIAHFPCVRTIEGFDFSLEFCILSERKAYRLPDRPFGDRNARRNSGASRQVDHVII